jgi:geranylgeranyl diphosphate synthase type I
LSVLAPASLSEIAARVDARITGLLETETTRWSAVDSGIREPLTALRRLVEAGGKRLRPAFCFWAFVGAGGDPDDPRVLDAAAALELQHVSAIIHDDIIDDSPRRHGAETIHRTFAHRHGAGGWRGEDRRFGEGAAILIGNLAAAYADQLLSGAPAAAIGVFADLRLEVNAGQYLDLAATARDDVDPARALRICQYKSARYTVVRPLHLGAALLGEESLQARAGPLSSFGEPLGVAFQLRDDVLDAFGDPTRTGKPVGADFREGKATYLYALAREAASGEARRFLADRYGRSDLTDDQIGQLQAILAETGARARTERLIADLLADARAADAALPLTEQARAALAELAGYVAGRDQ